MEEEAGQQENTISAPFPSPPPFFEHFTPENVARLEQLQSEGQDETVDLAQLPHDLKHLVPPEPPASGLFRSFGGEFDISNPLPDLRSQRIEQLYTTPPGSPFGASAAGHAFDRQHELLKITRSVLVSFVELVDGLAADPEACRDRLDDIRTMFINAHHLINEYRPHMTRESLISMMKAQLEKKRAEVEGVRQMKEKVDGVLSGLRDLDLRHDDAPIGLKSELDSKRNGQDKARRIWDSLDLLEV